MRLATSVAALRDALGSAWRTPARKPPARLLASSTLVGGLVVAAALLALVLHVVSSQHAGVASRRPPPTAPAASPAPPVDQGAPPAALSPVETPSPTPLTSPSPRSTPSPSPASVTLLNGPLAGHRGRSVSLRARTTPGTVCSIDVGYASAPTLDPATSDADGVVSWTWRVSGPAPSGSWPVTVTCGGASATVQIVVS